MEQDDELKWSGCKTCSENNNAEWDEETCPVKGCPTCELENKDAELWKLKCIIARQEASRIEEKYWHEKSRSANYYMQLELLKSRHQREVLQARKDTIKYVIDRLIEYAEGCKASGYNGLEVQDLKDKCEELLEELK
jgi:hypothetical protein